MQNVITGIISAILMMGALSYSYFKRVKKTGTKIKKHCILGYLALISSVVHVNNKIFSFSFSESYLVFWFLVMIFISGVLLRYSRKKAAWRHVHVALAAGSVCLLLLHIIRKIIYMLIIG